MKHKLKITNLKLTLRNDPSKVESDLKTKSADPRERLAKKTSKFETLKEDHEEILVGVNKYLLFALYLSLFRLMYYFIIY